MTHGIQKERFVYSQAMFKDDFQFHVIVCIYRFLILLVSSIFRALSLNSAPSTTAFPLTFKQASSKYHTRGTVSYLKALGSKWSGAVAFHTLFHTLRYRRWCYASVGSPGFPPVKSPSCIFPCTLTFHAIRTLISIVEIWRCLRVVCYVVLGTRY